MSESVNLNKASVNLDKHVGELNEYEKVLKHANTVLFNLSSERQESLDKNDLYELSYIIDELDLMLKSNLVNDDIKTSAKALLSKLQIIDYNISERKIKDIVARPLKSLSKINKAKYGDKNKYKGLKDPKQKTIKHSSSMEEYIKRRVPTIIIAFVLMMLTLDGGLVKIMDTLLGGLNETVQEAQVDSSTELEAQVDSSTELEGSLENNDNEVVKASINEMQKDMSEVTRAMTSIISLIASIMAIMLIIMAAVDLIYLMFPFARDMMSNSPVQFCSNEALEAVKAETSYVVDGKVINSDDRFETAIALLNIMTDSSIRKTIREPERLELIINKVNPAKLKDKKRAITIEKLNITLEDISERVKAYDDSESTKYHVVTKEYIHSLVASEMIFQCLRVAQ